MFTVTFLGTGTSTGVPMLACDCAVCQSTHPYDQRLRPSILVNTPSGTLLIDATPDMRTQLLRANVGRLDGVFITHTHADHIFGLDDVRQFTARHEIRMPIYSVPEVLDRLKIVYDYCFKETQAGGAKPQLDLTPITPYEPLDLCGLEILPTLHLHGKMPVLSFVFGKQFAYVTDVSQIPEATKERLRGVDTLVLGTVRYEPHPSHFCLQEAIEAATELGARKVYLTHLSHYFGHEALTAELAKTHPNILPAYDGLQLSF
jgi:phosphoribosyl 1,2-cyclic phosphate phosphodiesterase